MAKDSSADREKTMSAGLNNSSPSPADPSSHGGLLNAVTLDSWLSLHTADGPLTTNQPAEDVPFQRWFRFKEAFSPRLVVDAISSLPSRPRNCLDPFGGVGTTSLTCQFLGISPITIEVNPFLADVIEAKLSTHEPDALMDAYSDLCNALRNQQVDVDLARTSGPPTLCEPGEKGRWVFYRDVFEHLLRYKAAIDERNADRYSGLFRVLLGSQLIKLSNVFVNGKGRRYRSNWRARTVRASDVDQAFQAAYRTALFDICRYKSRPCRSYNLIRGDSRTVLNRVGEIDFALFSPPYPNSFDYTDIYNVELWILGYLNSQAGNRSLRDATLRSHVQIKRSYDLRELNSQTLSRVQRALSRRQAKLWNPDIALMIPAYFTDLVTILKGIRNLLSVCGHIMIIVGDSRYAGIPIPVTTILSELAPSAGLRVLYQQRIRALRTSAQQGGAETSNEHLLCLARQ